jgi:hypothetical protein
MLYFLKKKSYAINAELLINHFLQPLYLLCNLLGGAGIDVAEGGEGSVELLKGSGVVAALELLAHEADLLSQLDAFDEAFPLG